MSASGIGLNLKWQESPMICPTSTRFTSLYIYNRDNKLIHIQLSEFLNHKLYIFNCKTMTMCSELIYKQYVCICVPYIMHLTECYYHELELPVYQYEYVLCFSWVRKLLSVWEVQLLLCAVGAASAI
jgi:hypothetical protein